MSTIWPAADWELWPLTRTGAVVIALWMPLLIFIADGRTCMANLFTGWNGKCCGSCGGRFWGPVAVGCLAGLWLHFIPCFWWTCDWGVNDGEGVRGGIWFGVWIIVAIWGWVVNFCC